MESVAWSAAIGAVAAAVFLWLCGFAARLLRRQRSDTAGADGGPGDGQRSDAHEADGTSLPASPADGQAFDSAPQAP